MPTTLILGLTYRHTRNSKVEISNFSLAQNCSGIWFKSMSLCGIRFLDERKIAPVNHANLGVVGSADAQNGLSSVTIHHFEEFVIFDEKSFCPAVKKTQIDLSLQIVNFTNSRSRSNLCTLTI